MFPRAVSHYRKEILWISHKKDSQVCGEPGRIGSCQIKETPETVSFLFGTILPDRWLFMILLDDRMGLTSNREVLIYSLNAPICRKGCRSYQKEASETFPVLERKGDHSFQRMVESRIHYVNQKEWRFHVAPRFLPKAIRSIHPLCSPRSTPTWPFDVKPPTRIPKEFADPRVARQLLPTMSVSSYLYVRA